MNKIMLFIFCVILVALPAGASVPYVLNETGLGSTTSQDTSGLIRWAQFVPNNTINVLSIKIASCGGSGAFRLALYDDSSNTPNNLLVETGSVTCQAGWDNVSVSNVSRAGIKTWIAMQTQATVVDYYTGVPGGQSRYRSYTYGAFPATAGSMSDANEFNMRAGFENNIYILSYGNDLTNNNNLSIDVTQKQRVKFNVTTNISCDNCTWSVNGSVQSNNSNYFNYTFINLGNVSVKLIASNTTFSNFGHCPNLEYLIKNQKIAPNSIDDQLNLPALQESQSLSTYP
ncbi:MAG: hypothetical protein O8C61_10160 [Candidatus Methanoperedens sp.]|nr:hypothetical protein [Candidatus Methanoperedens sp.]